jgi:hypothetical protein
MYIFDFTKLMLFVIADLSKVTIDNIKSIEITHLCIDSI